MAYNITKTRSASTAKKSIFVIAVVVCLVIIYNLATSTYDLWSKKDVVVTAQDQLKAEKAENKKLKDQLTFVQSPDFIEQEARNKLLMVKEGESEVIVPKELLQKKEKKVEKKVPNYQQWIDLFVGN